jgi:hypothetical protein
LRKGHVAATVSAASRARITVSAFLRTRHRRTDGASLCVPKDLQGAWRHRASRQLSRWLTAIHKTSLSFPFVSSKTRRRIALLAASLHRRGTAPSPAPRRRCTVPAPSSASCASITLRMWYLPRPFAPFHLRDGLSSSYATALRELRWHVILDRTLTVRGGACVLTLGGQRTETAFGARELTHAGTFPCAAIVSPPISSKVCQQALGYFLYSLTCLCVTIITMCAVVPCSIAACPTCASNLGSASFFARFKASSRQDAFEKSMRSKRNVDKLLASQATETNREDGPDGYIYVAVPHLLTVFKGRR